MPLRWKDKIPLRWNSRSSGSSGLLSIFILGCCQPVPLPIHWTLLGVMPGLPVARCPSLCLPCPSHTSAFLPGPLQDGIPGTELAQQMGAQPWLAALLFCNVQTSCCPLSFSILFPLQWVTSSQGLFRRRAGQLGPAVPSPRPHAGAHEAQPASLQFY